MILEEVIKHYQENGIECEKEYKQLVEWLEDYNEKSKLVRYFYNYYPTDSHSICPKCGEYVRKGLICLSCDIDIPKGG